MRLLLTARHAIHVRTCKMDARTTSDLRTVRSMSGRRGGSVRTGKLGPRVVPALLVKDMTETLAFYRKLGFVLSGYHPDQNHPTWAEVVRDGVTFQFHTEPPRGTPSDPVCSGTLYMYPESVAALADELRGKVEFSWGPEVMEYGMREFGLRDPNGYYLAFSEPA